jgi:hypothetical protein
MANVSQSGTIYVNATGLLYTGRVKVAYILFTPATTGDLIELQDGTAGSSPIKCKIYGATATDTKLIDLSANPLVFNSGIYCNTLTAGATATLVLTTKGEGFT